MSLYQEYEPTPDNPCEIKGFRWLYGNDRRERMKVIDLLNKIAKGEEVPKKIKYNGKKWIYRKNVQDYIYGKSMETEFLIQEILKGYSPTKDLLFYELEIIEEKPKHIEEVKVNIRYKDLAEPYGHNESMFMRRIIMQQNKIDELTKAVNYLLDKE